MNGIPPRSYSRSYWKHVSFFLIFYAMWASPGGAMALFYSWLHLAAALSYVLLAGGLEIAVAAAIIVYLYSRVGHRTPRARFCVYGAILGGIAGGIHSLTPLAAFWGTGTGFFVANGACGGLFASFMATRLLPPPEELDEGTEQFEQRMFRRLTIPIGLSVVVLVWWGSAFFGFD